MLATKEKISFHVITLSISAQNLWTLPFCLIIVFGKFKFDKLTIWVFCQLFVFYSFLWKVKVKVSEQLLWWDSYFWLYFFSRCCFACYYWAFKTKWPKGFKFLSRWSQCGHFFLLSLYKLHLFLFVSFSFLSILVICVRPTFPSGQTVYHRLWCQTATILLNFKIAIAAAAAAAAATVTVHSHCNCCCCCYLCFYCAC